MCVLFFFFKQKTAYEMLRSLVGSEMCIRDRTIAWFDAFQRQAILSRVLHPTILTVHSHFIAAKRCHRALYAPTPASPQIPASHGAAPSASRLVINEYTQQLDPAKEMLKNVGSGHNWDSDVATCIVDIDNNQVPSSRLPEDGASVYHFHVQDADRFVKIATNGTHGAPKDFNHPFDVIVEPVVGDEQNNYAIAWGPLGRALSELSTIQPPPPPNPTTTSNHNGSSAASNICLLYTSDAADEEDSVDLGGRRIIKKKKTYNRIKLAV
eukprot:TRINITY_DN30543_c0_g1_i1.p1 TRINITY_DN30543_c0_g1~~TRINITY_DN30543_c0_g1_i1.p1  ORF type:complete len:267 (+),score=53.82 TRINITY_DN30543_c0_g1_i1:70-870(+)